MFSDERLEWIQENCARLGVTVWKLNVLPASCRAGLGKKRWNCQRDAGSTFRPVSWWTLRARIPAWMRRRVDLRWRIQPEEIERLRHRATGYAPASRDPGETRRVLVYSTCSLSRRKPGSRETVFETNTLISSWNPSANCCRSPTMWTGHL